MKMKTLISTGLSVLLAASLLAGCGSSKAPAASSEPASEKAGTESEASGATEEGADKGNTSDEIVTLKWYMSINPVAPDTDKVIEKLNEYTREKIGAEIDYTVIANPDYKEKMPTLINSGDYFDICFTSNWTTNYLQFAAKDAFLDITELLPEYDHRLP